MAIEKVRVQRNLKAKMRWLALEVDDLILLGLLWVGTELASNFIHRTLFGLPAEAILPWLTVLLTYVGIRLFKYNRPPAIRQIQVLRHNIQLTSPAHAFPVLMASATSRPVAMAPFSEGYAAQSPQR